MKATVLARRRLIERAPNVKHILLVFATIFTLLGVAFLFAPLGFVRYEIAFQSGMMGFLIVVMTLLLSCIMWGNELCQCHGEFYLLNRHFAGIIFCSGCAAFWTSLYIWNITNVLLMCPQFEVNTSATLEEQSEINITLSYMAPSHGMMRRQSLNLRYNTDKRCLVRKQTNNPVAEELGIFQMESFRYEAARHRYLKKHKQWLAALKASEEEEEEDVSETEEMQFYMLQNEIAMLLEEASQPYDKSSGFATRSIVPLQTTSNEDDEKFQYDRAAKICRNEKGFGWFLLGILVLCELLYFITIIVFYWLWTWMPILAPIRSSRLHKPECNTRAVATTAVKTKKQSSIF